MSKYDLIFNPPLMNASGSLGFAPNPHGPIDLDRLGAFVTNPISLRSRRPASGSRYMPYKGGFLLHTGYPNPGLEAVVRHYASHWDSSPLPVIVHLLASDPFEVTHMVAVLEELPGVACFEFGLSPESDSMIASEFVKAAIGELPIVLRLPFEGASDIAHALVDAGLAAISLAPPRGVLMDPNGKLVHGRLYGPAIYPQALEQLSRLVDSGLAVIASGGIYRAEQVDTLLEMGATAVQLDAALWRGEFDRLT